MEGDKTVESTSKAFESERSGCFSVSNMGDEDFDRNATTDLFKQADASGLFNVPPFERSTNQSVSAAELAENRVLQLEAKVKVLEKRLEEWGKRCDEADSVEEDLRLQLYKNSEAWKIERLSLMQKLEALKEENERLRNDIFEMNGTDRADKLELENLRSAKRMWTKEKKEKDEEIATLTSRIIALRKELRRIVAKNSGGGMRQESTSSPECSSAIDNAHSFQSSTGVNAVYLPMLTGSSVETLDENFEISEDWSFRCHEQGNGQSENLFEKKSIELYEQIKRLSIDGNTPDFSEGTSALPTAENQFSEVKKESAFLHRAEGSRSAEDETPVSRRTVNRTRKQGQSANWQGRHLASSSVQRVTAKKRFISKRNEKVLGGSVLQNLKNVVEQCDFSGERLEHKRLMQLSTPPSVSYRLRAVERPQALSKAFRSISGDELTQTISSMTFEEFEKIFIIIDCRYPYEYAGGHIKGALNIHEPSELEPFFFPDNSEEFEKICRKVPIFYCEYSQKRGPTAAETLRSIDRMRNEENYPEVVYSEIYVLDRGYKQFYEDGRFIDFCEPAGYVKMDGTPFKECLKSFHMHGRRNVTRVEFAAKKRANPLHVKRLLDRCHRRSLDSPSQFSSKSRSSSGKSVDSPPKCVAVNRFSLSETSKE